MALEGGDAVIGTGLAGAIAKARKRAYGSKYNVRADARGLNEEAAAIIEYLVANTEVSVNVTVDDGILVETPDTIHGDTTDTGTGTGVGTIS
jgi:hypothetical protein